MRQQRDDGDSGEKQMTISSRNLATIIRRKISANQHFCSFELVPTNDPEVYDRFFRQTSGCDAIFHALAWRRKEIDSSASPVPIDDLYPSLKAAVELQRSILITNPNTSRECPLLLHCAAAGLTRSQIRQILQRALELGVVNVFALRGDSESIGGEFANASDLVGFIRKEFGNQFCICVAGYPEMHPQSTSREADIMHLKMKVDAGANFVIGQICFESEKFIDWVKECRRFGIDVPIIPGIYSFQTAAELRRMCSVCKVQLPEWLSGAVTSKDDETVAHFGIDLSVNLIRKIRQTGASLGYHLFTLNRSDVFVEIYHKLQGPGEHLKKFMRPCEEN